MNNENPLMNNKYILYTRNTKTVFDSIQEAKEAFEKRQGEPRFLYQPDKTYFVGTMSSTGSVVGHDHMYHKSVAKCTGLFIAKNKNQIKVFLEKACWYHGGASWSTKARLYGKGPYGSLYQSNIEDEWELFEYEIQDYYLSPSNINSFSKLKDSYGAIDIKTYKGCNPYKLW